MFERIKSEPSIMAARFGSIRAMLLIVGFMLSGVGQAFAQGIPSDADGFTAYMAGRIKNVAGATRVDIKSPLTLSVGTMQANLDRVFAFCKSNAERCAAEIETYVKAVVEMSGDQFVAAPTKSAVHVVVRPAQYADQRAPNGSSPGILHKSFVGGLILVAVLDTPRAVRPLNENDAKTLNLTTQQVYDVALANLRKTANPIKGAAPVGNGKIGQLTSDFFHPSRLALLDLWAPLAKAQNGTLIVAAPATDAVLYIGEDSPIAVDALRTFVKHAMGRVPNPLSAVLLRWTPKGWQVVP